MHATLYILPILLAGQVITASSLVGVRDDLHFPIHSRATNNDGSLPKYKNPATPIEDRVNDLLPRMTLEEKVSQL
jgi:beta-glucosidase